MNEGSLFHIMLMNLGGPTNYFLGLICWEGSLRENQDKASNEIIFGRKCSLDEAFWRDYFNDHLAPG